MSVSALLIGAEDPVAAHLALKLAQEGLEVAVTLSPHLNAQQPNSKSSAQAAWAEEAQVARAKALTRRGVEVFFCDPLDPLTLSAALAGRDEVYVCLTPTWSQGERDEVSAQESAVSFWWGVGRAFGGALKGLFEPPKRGQSLDQELSARHIYTREQRLKEPLSATLEACALTSAQLPKLTLLCSALCLAPSERLICPTQGSLSDALTAPTAPRPPLSALGRFWAISEHMISALSPSDTPRAPTWAQAHHALRLADQLGLCVALYGLPYHEGELLSEVAGVELISWLKPSVASFVKLERLLGGLQRLRRARAQDPQRFEGLWCFGGPSAPLEEAGELFGLHLREAQRLAPNRAPLSRWSLSSARAKEALGYQS